MTNPELHERIEAALRASRRRSLRVTFGDQTVWVKRPRHRPGYTLYGLQYGAAQLLGIELFRPPRVSRGASGLAAEARRLVRLQEKGWPVPKVLGLTERWLATSDNGPTLSDVLHGLEAAERPGMLRAALEFLQTLHAGHGWHGGAQTRNLTRLPNGFGAIDFEDDLEPSMPLEMRQARDLYLFLISAARFTGGNDTVIPQLLDDALHRAAAPVEAEMRAVGGKLVQARRLLGWIAPYLGRDGPALSSIALAFQLL